jgi:tripartite-type tricarboxylate transporter receptor subunit TctC
MSGSHRLLGAALALLLATAPTVAQPDTTLNIIVPAAAGSAPDIIARVLGDELRTRLGQTTVIDNKAGAGGIVAVMAMKTAPSPNTLLLAHAAVVTITPLTYRAAKYDLAQDMEPVVVVADTPMLFVANAGTGPKTLAEAIAAAKAKPGDVAITTTARGSIPNLSAEILAQSTGANFNVIPMGTSGQAMQAVINGDSLVSVDGIAPLLPMVKSGRLRALAVTSPRPLPGLEGMPLAKDTVPGLQATGWFVLFARKGTPAARIQQLNEAVNAALKAPEMQQKLAATANFPVGGSVADARAFVQREKALWASAVQRAGLKPE